MRVAVRLFAAARQAAGRDTLEVDLPEGATVADLRRRLRESEPALAAILPSVLFALDARYAAETAVIPENAAVACIPPVSGG